MKKTISLSSYTIICLLVLCGFIVAAAGGSRVVTVFSEPSGLISGRRIIIDPGHGWPDGGASSCTGILESNINLEISLRLEDLFHLLGYHTVMIRTTDCSVYTSGETIAQRKISDLKERVRIINEADNAIFVSIHQNYFSDNRYHGAQVFHTGEGESQTLAKQMQLNLVSMINPGSNRKCKRAEGVYLMNHVNKPGVLVECGFISNPEEEEKLRSPEYQKEICAVIALSVANFLDLGNVD